jgi:formate dehydrogenase gamma subunit
MSKQKFIERFSFFQRIEHWLLVASFTTLAVTGVPQKYAEAGISDFIITLLGGIETVRIIHRVAATIFILEAVYHLVLLGYKLYVMKGKATMMPGIKDATDVIESVLYNLGIRKNHPKMGRFNYAEKLEYLAMIWGLILMGLTGFMLWNPIATSRILPGQFIPAAKAAHGAEAVLAVLAILIWHFYSVHLKRWNWSMFNGKLSREEMEEEHALELEEIDAGKTKKVIARDEQKKRLTIYTPVASVVTIALVAVVVYFITFEQTALTTITPLDSGVVRFVRQTATSLPTKLPTSTPAPTATALPASAPTAVPLTWSTGIGALFADNCSMCHGASASGGLNVSTYADTMKGGASGVAIKAGDPAGSLLITKMSGDHPKLFSPDNLAKIQAWIKAGALEK